MNKTLIGDIVVQTNSHLVHKKGQKPPEPTYEKIYGIHFSETDIGELNKCNVFISRCIRYLKYSDSMADTAKKEKRVKVIKIINSRECKGY